MTMPRGLRSLNASADASLAQLHACAGRACSCAYRSSTLLYRPPADAAANRSFGSWMPRAAASCSACAHTSRRRFRSPLLGSPWYHRGLLWLRLGRVALASIVCCPRPAQRQSARRCSAGTPPAPAPVRQSTQHTPRPVRAGTKAATSQPLSDVAAFTRLQRLQCAAPTLRTLSGSHTTFTPASQAGKGSPPVAPNTAPSRKEPQAHLRQRQRFVIVAAAAVAWPTAAAAAAAAVAAAACRTPAPVAAVACGRRAGAAVAEPRGGLRACVPHLARPRAAAPHARVPVRPRSRAAAPCKRLRHTCTTL